MPDLPNEAAAVTAQPQTAPAQPADFKVPEGKVLLDASEAETWKRNSERLRGVEPFWQAATKAGLRDPKQFDVLGQLVKSATSKKVDLNALIQALNSDMEADPGPTADGQTLDLASIKKQLGGEFMSRADFEKELAKERAMRAHESAMSSEKGLLDKALSGLLGENVTDWDRRSVMAFIDAKRGLYPEDHPLHGSSLSPFDEKALSGVLEELKKERAALTGKQLESAADAAIKGTKTPSAAGGGVSATNKTKSDDEGDENEVGSKSHRNKVEKLAEQLAARRAKGPLSSLGG